MAAGEQGSTPRPSHAWNMAARRGVWLSAYETFFDKLKFVLSKLSH
jgi:hypothetical protein